MTVWRILDGCRLDLPYGKLFSKLIQIILLLAISLPLLTFVRVFGGVPWGYVVSSLCITLTALIFVGSVSLLFSIFFRRAYVVIVVTVLTLGALFWLLSGMLIEWFGHPWSGGSPLCKVALYPNPYMLLGLNSDILFNPRMVGTRSVSVLAHCGIMLAASAGGLCVCVRKVHELALTRAVTGARILGRAWHTPPPRSVACSVGVQSAGPIRRVTGPPVMWKELISRSSGREKIFVRTIIVTELVMIVAIYLFPYVAVEAGMDEAHAAYVAIFMGLGALAVTVVPASSITSEKETRAWPLLLTTMVSDWEILLGKFVGVLRRCLPIWAVLLVYVWGMAPEGMIQAAGLVVATTVFLCGTGFYVSSRLRQTASAVAANFIIAALIWGILPALVALATFTFRPVYGRSLIERCW